MGHGFHSTEIFYQIACIKSFSSNVTTSSLNKYINDESTGQGRNRTGHRYRDTKLQGLYRDATKPELYRERDASNPKGPIQKCN